MVADRIIIEILLLAPKGGVGVYNVPNLRQISNTATCWLDYRNDLDNAWIQFDNIELPK